jgi:hypothetical protein
MKKKIEKMDRAHPAFKNKNADPFYNIVMKGLTGEVDGEHFFPPLLVFFTNSITLRDA